MDLSLRHRVALVTGGSAGIGRGIARRLAAEGARVVICARRMAPLRRAAREIGAEAFRADVTREADVRRLAAHVRRRHGRLDALVNNAGGLDAFGTFERTRPAEWRRSWEWNFLSAVVVTQAMLPLLRRSSEPRILLLASEVARQPFAFAPDYCAAKAALLSLNKSLANELAREKILVNAICPGPVLTESWEAEAKSPRDLKRIVAVAAKRVPLGRIGDPDDVADLAAFLCAPRVSWITGAAFEVDGGSLRTIA